MARPRKPPQLAVIQGTYRPDRRRPKRPGDRLAKLPPPPPDLSEAASKAWIRTGEAAIDAGVLTSPDLELLRLCAQAQGTAAECEQVIKTEGFATPCASGGTKAHPAVKVLEAARNLALRCLVELGLSPRARNNVAVAPEPTPYDPEIERFFT